MSNQIEEVKDKTDIVQVIGESVKLTRAGTNYKGLCPFHNEKSPSFMVSSELQIYKCFGCGAGGDVFTFLQEYEGMEFGEALRYLAERAGVKLEPIKGQQSSVKEKLLELQELSSKYYQYILKNLPDGQVAREYLLKRGLQQGTIDTFGIGFAPNKPSSLSQFLKRKYKVSDQELIDAGLAVQTQRGMVDRFRGRVIFPIYDHRGNAIALAGRILPEFDTGKVGKYINSPETAIYHKSKSLFGLNVTRSAIKRAGKAVVVEGEVDAISSWQSGIQNVVAIKGSALTEEQVLLLSRYARTFVLALDADFAGDNAALKAITQAQLKGVDILVADMHPHKDPDEFAQKDPAGYKQALEKAIGVWDFMINVSLARHDKTTGAGKAAISRELTPLLASIPDRIVQAHYVGILAQKLSVPAESVAQQVAGITSKGEVVTKEEQSTTKERTADRRELLEERVLSLAFIYNPDNFINHDLLAILSVPVFKKIAEHFITAEQSEGKFDTKRFYEDLPEELQERFSQLLLNETGDVNLERELHMALHELQLLDTKTKIDRLSHTIADLEEKDDEEKLAVVQQEFSRLTKRLAQLQDHDI